MLIIDWSSDVYSSDRDEAHLHVDCAAAPVRDAAGDAGADHLVGGGGDGNRRRTADLHEQRRQQEAAAHSEHPGQHANNGAEPQDEEPVLGHSGDGKRDLPGTKRDQGGWSWETYRSLRGGIGTGAWREKGG